MLLLLLASAWAQSPSVISLEEALRRLAPPEPAAEAPGRRWLAHESRTDLRPVAGGLEVVQELELRPVAPGWVALRLLDGRVILQDGGSPVLQGPDGHWWWVGRLEAPTTLRVAGFLPLPATAVELVVPSAPRQRVSGGAEGLDLIVEGEVSGTLPPTERLAARWQPARPPAEVLPVVQAEVAAAAWVLDEGMQVRASVRFMVRRGSRDRFVLRLPGQVQELDLRGPRVAEWRRSGEELTVISAGPVAGSMELTLTWRQPIAGGRVALGLPEPVGVNVTASHLTLAGDAELLLAPSAGPSLRPVALSELPARARALGDAQPTAAWSGRGVLQVQALRLEPIDGPALVIDQADCVEAFAASGRSLARCRLDVRNDSEQYLIVRLPEGVSLWSARVSGEGVAPVRMADGSVAVPLERSVETLAGLTAMDVELTFRGERSPWGRRGEQTLSLPSFNAPVARLEWELRLPPGFEGRREAGSVDLLAGSATGESLYSYAGPLRERADEPPPPERPDEAQEVAARSAWNNALQAYQDNDFSAAQGWIDQTLTLDPGNANAVRLQTNLDVLSGADSGGEDEAMSRRVKDMAKAKVAGAEVEQEESMREAEEALRMGDYDRAIEAYEKSLELAEALSVYEQAESREQAYRASSSSSSLAVARARKAELEADPEPVAASKADKKVAEDAGVMGLIGTKGQQTGSYGAVGLGTRGSGLGGGGTAEGLGGLGTAGRGSGASGYGSGGGVFVGDAAPPPPPPPAINTLSFDSFDLSDLDGVEGEEAAWSAPSVVIIDEEIELLDAMDGDLVYGGVVGGVEGGVMGGVMGGVLYGASAEPSFDEVVVTGELVRAEGAFLQNIPAGRSYQSAAVPAAEPEPMAPFDGRAARRPADRGEEVAAHDDFRGRKPPPARAPAAPPQRPDVLAANPELPQGPPIQATSLAIPLPDHGLTLRVGQRLLAPGEAPTLTLKYREPL